MTEFKRALLCGAAIWAPQPEPLPQAFWSNLASVWATYKEARARMEIAALSKQLANGAGA